MEHEATNVEESKNIHLYFGLECTGSIQTVYGDHTDLNRRNRISNPETGYPVSFTPCACTNVPRFPEGHCIVRVVAETPEKALEVANSHCGGLGRDIRIAPLSVVASLFNSSDHNFNSADLLRIAESEGKSVRSFGEAGQQRFELWAVEGVNGTFVSVRGTIRYLPTLSPSQTIFEIQNIDQMTEGDRLPALQELLDALVFIDREANGAQLFADESVVVVGERGLKVIDQYHRSSKEPLGETR